MYICLYIRGASFVITSKATIKPKQINKQYKQYMYVCTQRDREKIKIVKLWRLFPRSRISSPPTLSSSSGQPLPLLLLLPLSALNPKILLLKILLSSWEEGREIESFCWLPRRRKERFYYLPPRSDMSSGTKNLSFLLSMCGIEFVTVDVERERERERSLFVV